MYRIIAVQATVHLAGLDYRLARHSRLSLLVMAAQEPGCLIELEDNR